MPGNGELLAMHHF